MTRSKLLLIIGIAFTAVAVVVTVVIVTAHRDGTVQIRERLFFETPPEDGTPVCGSAVEEWATILEPIAVW